MATKRAVRQRNKPPLSREPYFFTNSVGSEISYPSEPSDRLIGSRLRSQEAACERR